MPTFAYVISVDEDHQTAIVAVNTRTRMVPLDLPLHAGDRVIWSVQNDQMIIVDNPSSSGDGTYADARYDADAAAFAAVRRPSRKNNLAWREAQARYARIMRRQDAQYLAERIEAQERVAREARDE